MLAMVVFLRVDSALEDRLVRGNTFFIEAVVVAFVLDFMTVLILVDVRMCV